MAAIYVSSTYMDLRKHRAAVLATLRELGHIDMAMEHYAAEQRRPIARCLCDVDSCDLYIGIFAWRYGYKPPHSQYSITETEFREAVRCEKEIRCFLVHPDAKWPEGFKDHGVARRRIAALRSELEAKYVVAYFVSPADLSGKVATTLAAWNQPLRTPLDVERKNRLMRTLLGAQTSRERERARHALHHMASPRYIAYLKGLLLDSHGTVETLTSYFDELIELNGPSLVLADLLQGKNQELRATVLYHIGELWLSGKHVSANTAKLLPALASAHDSETVFDLTHAIDKLIRARRYGDTDEPIPTYIVECLSTMAHAPYQEFAERARRTLRRIRRRRTLD